MGSRTLEIGPHLGGRQSRPPRARSLNLSARVTPWTASIVSGLLAVSVSPCRVLASVGLSDHPPYVCGVWPVCLSLGLVRRASRVCWEPVAHRPPPPPPPCPQEWPSHSPLVPRGCDRMHRLYCAFLFLWLRRKQELDVLKSTCYRSKYCRCRPGPASLSSCCFAAYRDLFSV